VTGHEPSGAERLVRVDRIMGTTVSVHAIVAPRTRNDDEALRAWFERCARGCFDELHEMDRVFSPYRADSEISRLHEGTLTDAAADPLVSEVRLACARAEAATEGRFSANWRGWFDPTGYVKGWAVERAHEHWLHPLLEAPGVLAVGVNAGGDMQLSTAEDADWDWRVGVADPVGRGGLIATVTIRNGAVATSGLAERGAHILDPRTGRATTEALSATVIADGLTEADVWATSALVAGGEEFGWVERIPHTSGLLVTGDGRVRRWAGGIEVATLTSPLAGLSPIALR